MINVELHLYATLQRYFPEAQSGVPIRMTLSDGSTVGQLIRTLSIPQDTALSVLVNNTICNNESVLQEGDQVKIFPRVGGGSLKGGNAMKMLIVLFNLKPGQSAADYERWARETDVPTVKSLKSVADFRVHRTMGLLGSDASAPYKYVEVISVKDMAEFGADVASETMQKVAGEFQKIADYPVFMIAEQFA